jgi:hypothetical protein
MADDFSDYIFFASYVQPAPPKGEAIWSNTDEMGKLNGKRRKYLTLHA